MSDPSTPGQPPGPNLPVDTRGATDHMVYVYDSVTQGPVLAAVVPIRTSDQATEAGRLLVANGLEFADYPAAPMFAGVAPPTSADGVEGSFWLDRSTGLVFGPKGLDSPGIWPAKSRKALEWKDGRHLVEGSLVLGTHTLEAAPGVTALKLTNFGVGSGISGPNFVGLELVVGSDASLPGGLGWVALRPQGSHNTSRKDLRLGGHAGGELQDFQGRRFLVESDQPREFLHGAPKGLVFGIGSDEGMLEVDDLVQNGLWSANANGWTVPLDGHYRASMQCQITTQSERATARAQWLVDGVFPTAGGRQMEAWPGVNAPCSLTLDTRLVLQAGQTLGLRIRRAQGSFAVTRGMGQLLIERVG